MTRILDHSKPSWCRPVTGMLLALGFGLGVLLAGDTRPELTEPRAIDGSGILVPILLNNLSTAALLVVGGFTLGILTAITAAWSGFVWGLFFAGFQRSAGMDQALALGLPHGVFEIAWIVLFGGLGLSIAQEIWTAMHTRSIESVLHQISSRPFWASCAAGLVLVVIGALVEAFLTHAFAAAIVGP